MECVGVGVLLCTLSVNLNLWIFIPNSVYSGSAMVFLNIIFVMLSCQALELFWRQLERGTGKKQVLEGSESDSGGEQH